MDEEDFVSSFDVMLPEECTVAAASQAPSEEALRRNPESNHRYCNGANAVTCPWVLCGVSLFGAACCASQINFSSEAA